MRYTIILLLAGLLAACSASKSLSKADFEPVKSTSTAARGIYYHLPATVIKVEITAQKIIEKRGPFYRYSQRYLNLSDILTEDNTEWIIIEARLYTEGVPDPEKLFRITSEGTPAGAAVNLSANGLLKGLNLSGDEYLSGKDQSPESEKTIDLADLSFDDIPFTEEQLIKTSSAASAEEVAAEIYRLRDSRRRLLESDMQKLPPDNGAYERILNGIDHLEREYLSLFKGKRETETVKKTFSFVPDASRPSNQVLFRFSSQKGFSEIADMTGTPVYIDIQTDSVAENNSMASSQKRNDRSGLIYCRPAKATIKIIDRTLLLTEQDVLIAQFGTLHQLPASLLDNPGASVRLDWTTGAILEIKTKP
jgi:hypothetical protein